MSVEFKTVAESEENIRLDRWFVRHYPGVTHGLLEKLLRKKSIRVDNKKAAANTRLSTGQIIRIPPMDMSKPEALPKKITPEQASFIQKMVLYKDKDILILNKPAGLAVQGGTKTSKHIDGLLDGLKFDYDERPRLVHRLDKETSGLLVIARTPKSAGFLSQLFQTKEIHKTYWALVAGLPHPEKGEIKAPLAQKQVGPRMDRRMVDEKGCEAISLYAVQDHLADKISWLQMSPLTGRTHQLRIHAAQALKTPILGDTRYGPKEGWDFNIPKKMYLHARAISLPLSHKTLVVEAPLPEHFQEAFRHFGFSEKNIKPLFLRSQK